MNDAAPLAEAPAADEAAAVIGKNIPAKRRKALREKMRRRAEAAFEAAEMERLRAKREASPAEAPAAHDDAPAKVAPLPGTWPGTMEAAPVRTDAQRAGDAAAFLAGFLFPLLSLFAPKPWRLDLAAFTDDQAEEDGRAWVGLLARYPWLDRFVTWGAPLGRVVRRLRAIATRKDAP